MEARAAWSRVLWPREGRSLVPLLHSVGLGYADMIRNIIRKAHVAAAINAAKASGMGSLGSALPAPSSGVRVPDQSKAKPPKSAEPGVNFDEFEQRAEFRTARPRLYGRIARNELLTCRVSSRRVSIPPAGPKLPQLVSPWPS
jgi:hypothetical protein